MTDQKLIEGLTKEELNIYLNVLEIEFNEEVEKETSSEVV